MLDLVLTVTNNSLNTDRYRYMDWIFNGTPTQNYPVKIVPSKNNNANQNNFITINFFTNISILTFQKPWVD